jgi:hypothetical protein
MKNLLTVLSLLISSARHADFSPGVTVPIQQAEELSHVSLSI